MRYEDLQRVVEDAEDSEWRGIGSVWAGVAALLAGGLGAALRLDPGLCAVAIACTLAVGVGVSEWWQLRRDRRHRRARAMVRTILYGEMSPTRDELCRVLLERGTSLWELRDTDDADPVMWLCHGSESRRVEALDVVRCGQALRLIGPWRELCFVALRTTPDRYLAAKRVLEAVAAAPPERRRALDVLCSTWRGTFEELERAVGLHH